MKLFGTASVFFLANVVNAAIPLFMLPILTRTLTPEEYGLVAMYFATVNISSVFTGLGIHGAISVKFFELEREDLANYITTCLTILFASSTVVLFVVLLTQRWIKYYTDLSFQWIIFAVLASTFQFLIQIRLVTWQVAGKVWQYSFLQISRSLADASFSIWLVNGIELGASGRIYGNFAGILIVSIIGLVCLNKDKLIGGLKDWEIHLLDALKFGLPLVPHAIGGLTIGYVDRLIVNNVAGNKSLGIYMVAIQLGVGINLLAESFNKSYTPWLFRSLKINSADLKRKIVKGTYGYFVLIVGIATIYGMAIPQIVPIIVGKDFEFTTELIPYVSIGFAFTGCYYMVTNYLFYQKKTMLLALVTITCGVASVPITYYLVKSFQARGAAISFMVSNFLTFICTWILATNVYKMPWTLKTINRF